MPLASAGLRSYPLSSAFPYLINGAARDAEITGDLRRTVPLFQPLSDLVAVDFRWPALVDSALLGSHDPLGLALAPQIGLEFGKHPEHVEECLAGGRRGIDGLLRCEEMGALHVEAIDDHLKVVQRASQPVDPGDNKRLAGMDEVQDGVELRTPIERRPALLFLANDLAARGLEGGNLRGEVLVGGGGAGISDAGHAKLFILGVPTQRSVQ